MKPQASILTLAAFLLSSWGIRGEETTRSVQEELRRRNLYFGDVDGRDSNEVSEAVRRYQRKKGLSVTGQHDRETLLSLGLASRSHDEPPPRELDWPEEPVLKSDVAIDVVATAKELGREAGVSPGTLTGGKPVSTPVTTTAKRKSSVPSRITTSPTRASRSLPPIAARNDARIEETELTQYIREFLKALSRNDISDELRFYADRVDYYHNGWVDRRIIEETVRQYHRQWPSRSYRVADVLNYSFDPKLAQVIVTFRIEFRLKGSGKTVRGQTDNRFVISAATADPRIVSIDEQRVRH
jgi:peptidoglycan hydrolase-like protein with peptidoglycan-binding domain